MHPNTLLTQIEKAFIKADLQLQIKKERSNWAGLFNTLTEKEKEVVQYIKQGYSNKAIAEIMQVKPDTIKKKRAQILIKDEPWSTPKFSAIVDGKTFEGEIVRSCENGAYYAVMGSVVASSDTSEAAIRKLLGLHHQIRLVIQLENAAHSRPRHFCLDMFPEFE